MSGSVALVTNGARSLATFRGTLIAALVRDGVRVWALAPDHDADSRARLLALGAEPVDIAMARAGTNPLRDAADAARLALVLRRLRPDAALCYFLKPVVQGIPAAWIAGVGRRVALIEGLGHAFAEAPDARRRGLRAIVRASLRTALRQADAAVVLNDEDAAELAGLGVRGPALVVLGGIGVDLAAYAPAPPAAGPPVFVLMARLLRDKGVAEYAAAARIVRGRRPDARFVLLGGAERHPGAIPQAEVEGWARDGLVEWPGHVADVRDWIARSRAAVLPSCYREGVPRSLQEAAAMARAVVTTDRPGCRDAVKHGVTGLLVPPRDPAALAEVLERLAAAPAAAAAMGRAGRVLAQERFDARDKDARLRALLGV